MENKDIIVTQEPKEKTVDQKLAEFGRLIEARLHIFENKVAEMMNEKNTEEKKDNTEKNNKLFFQEKINDTIKYIDMQGSELKKITDEHDTLITKLIRILIDEGIINNCYDETEEEKPITKTETKKINNSNCNNCPFKKIYPNRVFIFDAMEQVCSLRTEIENRYINDFTIGKSYDKIMKAFNELRSLLNDLMKNTDR